MQDRGKTGNRIYFFIIMFFLAVLVSLLSLSGCGSRDDRNEEGLEEIALDEKETAHGEQGGAEADRLVTGQSRKRKRQSLCIYAGR